MMRRQIPPILLGVLLPVLGAAQQAAPDSVRAFTRAAVEQHVRFLAADSLKGRRSGTYGGALAAQYVATALDEMRALPAVPTTTCDRSGRCEWTYFQPFHGRTLAAPDVTDLASNIVALVPGTDGTLEGQWIVVGAHFDTFGFNGYGNVTSKDTALPGADDNASGIATVIELARRVAAAPLRRPVMFVLFAESERGDGSKAFIESLQQPADSIVAMFNFDMVGRLNAGRLDLYGTSTSRSWRPLIDSAATGSAVRTMAIPAIYSREHGYDHVPFAEQLIRMTGDGVRPWRAK